jgi:hypothetical protein
MRRFISTLSFIVPAVVLGLGCFAGTGHAANFSDSSIGISIDLDDELVEMSHWRGYRVFSSANNSASVLIKPVHDLSLYDLRQDLKGGGFDDVGAIDLVVTDSEQNASVDSGSGVVVPFKGRIGEYKVRGVFSAFSGFDDQHFFVIAAARPDYWNDWNQRYKAMFESIKFIKIDYSEMIANWYKRLSGKSLVPKNPPDQGYTQGYQPPQPIHLCSNGTVAEERSANTQPAAQQQTVWNGYAWVTVPMVPPPSPPALWRIEPIRGKPTLLILQGPQPERFPLEMEGDQPLMSGKPVSISQNKLCN